MADTRTGSSTARSGPSGSAINPAGPGPRTLRGTTRSAWPTTSRIAASLPTGLADDQAEQEARKNGVPLGVLAKRLGHSSPQITMEVYSHVHESMDDEAAVKLGSAFLGRGG